MGIQKLRQAQFWAGAGAIVLGISLAVTLSLGEYRRHIEQTAVVSADEFERLSGLLAWFTPRLTLGTLVLYTLGYVLVPPPAVDEAAVLRRVAKRKLRMPLLTEAEMQLWTQLLEEVKHDE
ncbi:MAG: hypothetical protein AAFY17_02555 [Cyanobacteria bacterium J06642_11]